jgi:cardiolipin synthase
VIRLEPGLIPNIISGTRILLVLPVAWCLWHHEYSMALVLFVVAGISDGIDGYLARRYHWISRVGGWLDPVADKLMQVTSYILLAWLALIPVWLVVLVLARDVLIVAGGTIYYYVVERVDAAPSLISKINTVFQILLVVLVLLDQLYGFADWIPRSMIYLVALTTVWSGIDYVVTWGMKAARISGSTRDNNDND